ncbi:MAG: hypothetical protein H7061_03205 [Bdellovibrionaceae bacterium]|nr:hypothetical protein [Bdellovibrio sp.]
MITNRSFIILALSILSSATFAGTFTEEFTSTTFKDTATAVWNTASGKVHPTLRINNYQLVPAGAFASADFDVGDGSHGVFDSSTYANFGTVVGSTITIDAAIFPALKLTQFNLAPGFVLTSVNGPLVIYSLSTILIDGTIQCSGTTGGNAAGAGGGAAGLGRCGGQNGGVGGNGTQSGTKGIPLAGAVTGGGGGNYVGAAPGAGGGGGGSYAGNPGQAGQNSAPNTLGAGGTTLADHSFTILTGGPGGGGGSGSNTEGGAGGGGGGGTIIIHAVGDVTVSVTGLILAKGGNGGAAVSGGGGGGGGGGSVQIFTPGQFALVPAGFPIDVSGGAGSVPSLAAAGDGGAGSYGRTWDVSNTFSGVGSESNASSLNAVGVVQYTTAARNVISKSYDTQSTESTFQSINSVPITSEVVFEVAGSNDNFAVDDTGFLPTTQINLLNAKRFVKFRMTLTNTNATTPMQIDQVQINYQSPTPADKENFNFKGCGLIHAGPPPDRGLMNILITMLLLLLPVIVSSRLKLSKAHAKNNRIQSKD